MRLIKNLLLILIGLMPLLVLGQGADNTRFNVITMPNWSDSVSRINDSLVSHNIRLLAILDSLAKQGDSLNEHNIRLIALIDSIRRHTDSLQAHNLRINEILDSLGNISTVEEDPIYAGDSIELIRWPDTTGNSKIATRWWNSQQGYVTGTPWTGMGYITDGNTNWDNSYGFITQGGVPADSLAWKKGTESIYQRDTTDNVGIGTTTPVAPLHVVSSYATGGTITYSGGYTIHTFTGDGTFTTPTNITASVLVVGGGGGGGTSINSNIGGGGGGGGDVQESSSYGISAGSYTVTVGIGGVKAASNSVKGTTGGTSTFGTLTAVGGGGGGSASTANGANGASGGGAAATGTGGTGTAGYNGGNGAVSSGYGSGGGGGDQQAGSNSAGSPTGNGGKGGEGYTSTISGASVVYGSGGGGGGGTSGAQGYGGTAGTNAGNGGRYNNSGTSAPANYGGGGGGAGGDSRYAQYGGDGGSGVVIISYLTPPSALFNGAVGIGTTAPETSLEVQGTEGSDAAITLDADDGDDNADTWFIESDATTNDLLFTNHTTNVARITDDGNFGINVTYPINKLSVSGGANIYTNQDSIKFWVDKTATDMDGDSGITVLPNGNTVVKLYHSNTAHLNFHSAMPSGGVSDTIIGINRDNSYWFKLIQRHTGANIVYELIQKAGSAANTPLSFVAGTLVALPTYSVTVGATNRDLYIDNTGLIGYVSSTNKQKDSIRNIEKVNWLYKLRPVNFVYRSDKPDSLARTDTVGYTLKPTTIYVKADTVWKDSTYQTGTATGTITVSVKVVDYITPAHTDTTKIDTVWQTQVVKVRNPYWKKNKQYGLVAEEVDSINNHIVSYDYKLNAVKRDSVEREIATVNYSRLTIPLLKAVQDHKAEIDTLNDITLSTQIITPDSTGIKRSMLAKTMYLSLNKALTVPAGTKQIANGRVDGQEITLVGMGNVKAMTLRDGDNININTEIITLKKFQTLTLIWAAPLNIWLEKSRSLN